MFRRQLVYYIAGLGNCQPFFAFFSILFLQKKRPHLPGGSNETERAQRI